MNKKEFEERLLAKLKESEIAQDARLSEEDIFVKGKVILVDSDYEVDIYFNSIRFVFDLSLSKNGRLIWKIATNPQKKWYERPLIDINLTTPTSVQTIEGAVDRLKEIWLEINEK